MKWMVFTGYMVSLCFSLSGCAFSSIDENRPLEVTSRIEVTRNEFKIDIKQDESTKVTSYTGPNCAENPVDHIVLIRARQIEDEPVMYQIYVSDRYIHERLRSGMGGKLYHTAHDIDGDALPTEVLSRSVNWCGKDECQYVEVVGVASRPYLEDRIARDSSEDQRHKRRKSSARLPMCRHFLECGARPGNT